MSQTPPAAPTRPTSIGTASGYGLFAKVNAAYDSATAHDPPNTTNPDYITYFANLQMNQNTQIARQVMQDGTEYAAKTAIQLGFSVDIYGLETDTKIKELLAAANSKGNAGQASAALVSPDGAAWRGWFEVTGGTPGTGPQDMRSFSFTFEPLGEASYVAAS